MGFGTCPATLKWFASRLRIYDGCFHTPLVSDSTSVTFPSSRTSTCLAAPYGAVLACIVGLSINPLYAVWTGFPSSIHDPREGLALDVVSDVYD